ncbi:MAG: serine hydrolase [Actinomycetota bacterium]
MAAIAGVVVERAVDLQGDTAVSTDDFFRIASITKPMTSVVIRQPVEEGLVELDESVATCLGNRLGRIRSRMTSPFVSCSITPTG